MEEKTKKDILKFTIFIIMIILGTLVSIWLIDFVNESAVADDNLDRFQPIWIYYKEIR